MSYDYESRVTSISGPGVSHSFTYNGLDARVGKVEGSGTRTFRRDGAGGRHVNKTEAAVRITHLPTAMSTLLGKLVELQKAKSAEEVQALKGEDGPAARGRQIRSCVMHPYTMVKDHRTGHETGNVDGFIEDVLKKAPDDDGYAE